MKDIAGNDYTTSFNRQVNLQVQIGIFKQYYIGSEKRNAFEMLKNGTLSIGFIGLWDAVGTLVGQEIDSVDIMKQYERDAFADRKSVV